MFNIRTLVTLISVVIGLSLSGLSQAADQTQRIPQHAKVAGFGVVLGLRGETVNPSSLPVRLTSEAASQLREPDFQYDRFVLHSVHVEDTGQVGDDPTDWRLLGLAVFEDIAARRVYTEFAAYYKMQPEGMSIYWAAASTRTPDVPTILWFAVEAGNVPEDYLSSPNHAQLLKLAGEVSLQGTQQEQDDATPKDYVVFAVSMDRFAASEEVTFKVWGNGIDVLAYNLMGWPVGIYKGRMAARDIGRLIRFEMSSTVKGTPRKISSLEHFPVRRIKSRYVESASPAPVLAGENDIALRLRKLEELHDADLITQYEYEVKRQEILDSL